MFKTVIAATLSVALALPFAALPARADGHDRNAQAIVTILGGLAVLYALKEAKDRRDDKAERARTPRPGAKIIPRRCVRSVRLDRSHRLDRGRGRLIEAYGVRCMRDRVARPRLLPERCLRRTEPGTRPARVYGPRCMEREGWRLARR